MLLKINPDNPQQRLIDKAVQVLIDGGVIAYPTDTFYGIGSDLLNKKGIQKIYYLKGERKEKPYSFACSDLKHISDYARVSNYAYRVMRKLLPGPYTFILEGTKQVPKIMLTKRKTAGIRVPNNNICLNIIKTLGHPIITTTATDNAGNVINDPLEIHQYFKNRIDLVIDGGPVPGEPSTVISLLNDSPEIVREGLGNSSIFQL